MQRNISGNSGGFACSVSEEVENVSTNQRPVLRSWVSNHSKKIQHFLRIPMGTFVVMHAEEVENVKGF